jgi:3-(3-hydroxy-phenyl)propionate hydroxylase
LELEGPRIEDAFVIVDVEDDPAQPLPPERLYFYEHPAVQKRNVLIVPFRNGIRADIQLRLGDDPRHFSDPEGVRQWLRRVLPERYADRVSWVSTYQFLQVVAETFTDANRRVLLAGEAAHLFAPFGARGLNSGVRDAVSAANAVGEALQSNPEHARTRIEQAANERREAALYNRTASSLALEHMRARDWRIRLRRSASVLMAKYGSRRAGSYLDSAPFGPRAAAKGTEAIY